MGDQTDPVHDKNGTSAASRHEAAGQATPPRPEDPDPMVGPPAELAEPRRVGDGAPTGRAAENTVWVGRTNWKHFAGRLMLAGAGYVVVMVALIWLTEWSAGRMAWIGFIGLVVVTAIMMGWTLLIVLKRRYRVTQQRLFLEEGILSKTIDQTELVRVDDVRVRKSLIDRMFGLGTVEVISTDSTNQKILIEGVHDPEEVAEHIRDHMRQLRQQSLFIENL